MKLFYPPSIDTFYDSQIHAPKQIPEDVVEISRESYLELVQGRAAGKIVVLKKRRAYACRTPQAAPGG